MRSATLVDVLLAELERDPVALEALAQLLSPLITVSPPAQPQAEGWLNSTAAAEYLGISRNALHKLTAERSIVFEQDGPGCKCWFRRSDLDAWRRGERVDAAKTQPRHALRATSDRNGAKKNPAVAGLS